MLFNELVGGLPKNLEAMGEIVMGEFTGEENVTGSSVVNGLDQLVKQYFGST